MTHENDYVKDGILTCGICEKPKQTRLEVFGEVMTVPALCDCQVEEQKKQESDFREMQRMIYIDNLRVNGIKDRERRKCRFENAEMTENLEKCLKYAQSFDEAKEKNIGIVMCGPCGNGKSFAAACIANALLDNGIPALMTSFPAILSDQNNTMDIAHQMNEYDLVVLDDLGAERQSQYALEKVFYVIDERYKSGKPLIVTTNLSYATMKRYRDGLNKYGEDKGDEKDYARIYDRVLGVCVPMVFKDGSRRIQPLVDKANSFKEMLEDVKIGEEDDRREV